MPTKRTLDQIKQSEFLKISELNELTGVRYSTIKYYGELGLLPYNQQGKTFHLFGKFIISLILNFSLKSYLIQVR